MLICASVRNSASSHEVEVRTGDTAQSLPVPSKAAGRGSSINGGEFLMLALATCYCNDLYREAERLGIELQSVEIRAAAEFPGIGLAATNITYQAKVQALASHEEISELLRQTDTVAEVHNTIRSGARVQLVGV